MPALSATLTLPVPFPIVGESPGGEGPFPVVLALHGYAMDAPTMLALGRRLVPHGVLLAAAQGPHSTIVPGTEKGDRSVGFHWGVSKDPQENRALHRAVVTTALEWCLSQGGDPSRVALLAFSQPCSFDYRLALDPPAGRPLRAVVGICGGIPGEWADGEGAATAASRQTDVLHVSTLEDPWYSMAKIARYSGLLASRYRSATHLVLPGGHRIPSAAADAIRRFLEATLQP
jgi:predicted esterase